MVLYAVFCFSISPKTSSPQNQKGQLGTLLDSKTETLCDPSITTATTMPPVAPRTPQIQQASQLAWRKAMVPLITGSLVSLTLTQSHHDMDALIVVVMVVVMENSALVIR